MPQSIHQQSTEVNEGLERRAFPRFRCVGPSASITATGGACQSGPLADVSLRGFYLECFSPFPVGEPVEWKLTFGVAEARGAGIVRSCHPSTGNGVEITEMTLESCDLILRSIDTPQHGKQLEPPSFAQAHSAGLIAALIEVLKANKVITGEQLEEALKRHA